MTKQCKYSRCSPSYLKAPWMFRNLVLFLFWKLLWNSMTFDSMTLSVPERAESGRFLAVPCNECRAECVPCDDAGAVHGRFSPRPASNMSDLTPAFESLRAPPWFDVAGRSALCDSGVSLLPPCAKPLWSSQACEESAACWNLPREGTALMMEDDACCAGLSFCVLAAGALLSASLSTVGLNGSARCESCDLCVSIAATSPRGRFVLPPPIRCCFAVGIFVGTGMSRNCTRLFFCKQAVQKLEMRIYYQLQHPVMTVGASCSGWQRLAFHVRSTKIKTSWRD